MDKKKQIENLYKTNNYVKSNKSIHEEDVDWKYKVLHDSLLCFFNENKKNKLKLVDVGGGTGELFEKILCFMDLKQLLIDKITCIDLTPKCLELQKIRFSKYKGDFIEKSILDFESKEYFDLLLLIHVVEHISNMDDLFLQISNYSNYVLIQIPLHKNFGEFIYNIIKFGRHKKDLAKKLGHVTHFSFFKIRKLIKKYKGTILYEDFPNVHDYFLKSHYKNTITKWFKIQAFIGFYLYKISPLFASFFTHSFYTVLIKFEKEGKNNG